MAADYYPSDEAESSDESSQEPSGMDDSEEERAEGETALVPKSLFAGEAPEVGDSVTLKVVHIYDDEIEVEPAKEEPEDQGSAMDEAQNSLSDMATKGA